MAPRIVKSLNRQYRWRCTGCPKSKMRAWKQAIVHLYQVHGVVSADLSFAVDGKVLVGQAPRRR